MKKLILLLFLLFPFLSSTQDISNFFFIHFDELELFKYDNAKELLIELKNSKVKYKLDTKNDTIFIVPKLKFMFHPASDCKMTFKSGFMESLEFIILLSKERNPDLHPIHTNLSKGKSIPGKPSNNLSYINGELEYNYLGKDMKIYFKFNKEF